MCASVRWQGGGQRGREDPVTLGWVKRRRVVVILHLVHSITRSSGEDSHTSPASCIVFRGLLLVYCSWVVHTSHGNILVSISRRSLAIPSGRISSEEICEDVYRGCVYVLVFAEWGREGSLE